MANIINDIRQTKKELVESAACCGPQYSENHGGAPLRWYDQVFERGFAPSGTVNCATALRVGSTQQGLSVVLAANHANTAPVVAAAGATITMTLYQSDTQDGTYEEVGPTTCVTAPAIGIKADPCLELARFALGNFQKPWLKVKLDFTGCSGGKLDCFLHYEAR